MKEEPINKPDKPNNVVALPTRNRSPKNMGAKESDGTSAPVANFSARLREPKLDAEIAKRLFDNPRSWQATLDTGGYFIKTFYAGHFQTNPKPNSREIMESCARVLGNFAISSSLIQYQHGSAGQPDKITILAPLTERLALEDAIINIATRTPPSR